MDKKIKANAVSAYLLFFISGLFLVNKNNPLINHPFVKSHTKTALALHITFLLIVIIFNFLNFLGNIFILQFSLGQILSSLLLIGTFGLCVYGVTQAHSGKDFSLIQMTKGNNGEKIEAKDTSDLSHRAQITLILTSIPLFGFFIWGKEYKKSALQNTTNINLFATLILIFAYLTGNTNLGHFFLLLYIIYISFQAVMLFGQKSYIHIPTSFLPTPEKIQSLYTATKKILQDYFHNTELKNISEYQTEHKNEKNLQEKERTKALETKKDFPLPNIILALPVINLITIFFLGSKQKFHIENGIILSVLVIIIFSLQLPLSYLTLLIPAYFFLYGYSFTRPGYHMPVISHLSDAIKNILKIFHRTKKVIKENNIEKNETFSVEK